MSGGLDSTLAALLVKNQGVKVQGLAFKSYFFNPQNIKKLAEKIKIPLKIIDFSEEHLKIVANPPHGYGKNANPCIDCHLLMFKRAKKIMEKESFDFVISGETLGQRPFSQNKNALALIEKEAGLKGLILRPLSAQLLPPTLPEQKGWVKRDKLLNIQGRSRKIQLKLAKKYGLKDFSTPGASCILTDPGFSQRLFKLLKVNPKCTANDIQLLRLGRHQWQDKLLIIIGRNHEENLKLRKLAQKNDVVIEPRTFPGPTILIRTYRKKVSAEQIAKAKRLLRKYSPKTKNKKISDKDFKICYI